MAKRRPSKELENAADGTKLFSGQEQTAEAPKQLLTTMGRRSSVTAMRASRSSVGAEEQAKKRKTLDKRRSSVLAKDAPLMTATEAMLKLRAQKGSCKLTEAEVTAAAFAAFDADGSGSLDKEEAFLVVLEMGQAPAGSEASARDVFEALFRFADEEDTGSLDVRTFGLFFREVAAAVELEDEARSAFSMYDVLDANSLDKAGLFRALLDLDVVPSTGSRAEKRAVLEEQFAIADVDGDGQVSFQEFHAFFAHMKTMAELNEGDMLRRKQLADLVRVDQLARHAEYVNHDSIFTAARSGDLLFLKASWVLSRAGYRVVKKVARETRPWKFRWRLAGEGWDRRWAEGEGEEEKPVAPLPSRAEIEASHPDAIFSAADLEREFRSLKKMVDGVAKTDADRARAMAVPIVMASHSAMPSAAGVADPDGFCLKNIAAQIANDMPTFKAWGLDDVGVFIDYACLHAPLSGSVEAAGVDAEAREAALRARQQLALCFAHRLTTVYILEPPEQPLAEGSFKQGRGSSVPRPPSPAPPAPAKHDSGWRLLEKTASHAGFKLSNHDNAAPFPLPTMLCLPWPKMARVGANAGMLHNPPPLSAADFGGLLGSLELIDKRETDAMKTVYTRLLEDGFNGRDALRYPHHSWNDAEIISLAKTLEQVPCPWVQELDLSGNFLTNAGLEAIAAAIAMGALCSLQRLIMRDCVGIVTVPDGFAHLMELQVLDLDGCVGLRNLPSKQAVSQLVCLKSLNVKNCHVLFDEELQKLPKGCTVHGGGNGTKNQKFAERNRQPKQQALDIEFTPPSVSVEAVNELPEASKEAKPDRQTKNKASRGTKSRA